jgi:hypothetical protein
VYKHGQERQASVQDQDLLSTARSQVLIWYPLVHSYSAVPASSLRGHSTNLPRDFLASQSPLVTRGYSAVYIRIPFPWLTM